MFDDTPFTGTWHYRAKINVKYENGEPCITAYAKYDNTNVDADTNGVLWFNHRVRSKERPPETKEYYCIVYKNRDNAKIWEGDIEMIRCGDYLECGWPEPFVEIVIPD
jgi:hypothetical protein